MEAWRKAIPCPDLSPDASMRKGVAVIEQRHSACGPPLPPPPLIYSLESDSDIYICG